MPSPKLPNEYPIEILAPDITPYAKGNTGASYVWRFEARTPGPQALISAVVHGNELCGAVALDWLLRRDFRPSRGALTLAFMNVEAYHAFDPANPNASRWVEEDFNRVWAEDVLDGGRDSVELRRARQVRGIVAAADYLLDIHSMQHKAPPMMMAGTKRKGLELAARIGVPQLVIKDAGHASGTRMRDHGAFDDADASARACLIECGQHWQASSSALAKESAARFLVALDMADPDLIAATGAGELQPQRFWEVTQAVTIESEFRFAEPFTGGEVLPEAGHLLGWDGEREVRTPYAACLLVMPSKRLWAGQTAVRLAHEMGTPV